MKALTETIVKTLDSKNLKRFKMIILFVFIGLIILDIIFVFPNGYPTISQVVYDSSPRFIILIFLFGLFVTNVFFQREVTQFLHFNRNFWVLLFVGFILGLAGFAIPQPSHITCDNYTEEINKVETPYITRVLCQDISNGNTERENRDCNLLDCHENIKFKIDFTVSIKLIILLLGIALGYYLWPSQKV